MKFNMRKILFVILCIVVYSACHNKEVDKSISKSIPAIKATQVEGVIATFQTINQSLKIPGKILPAEQITIHPEITGLVKEILFHDGQTVLKNQLLVRLNEDELIAKLKKFKIQKEILHNSELRQSELLKANAIGKTEYDNYLLQYKNVLSDIQILEAELRKYNLRAPFTGVIGFRSISPGEYISPSTNISTLTQIHPLKLKFSLPEQYIQRIKLNQKINFNCENQNMEYSATINSLSPFIQEETKTLEILASVDRAPKELIPGSYATVQLNLSQKDNSIFIPSQCIIPRIKDKQVALYKSGKVVFSTVTVAYRDSSRVEIVSGINKGDTIITTGLMKLKPGMSIILSNLIDKQ